MKIVLLSLKSVPLRAYFEEALHNHWAAFEESIFMKVACSVTNGASAGTRTRVQALATLGDNHYTTLAGLSVPLSRGINRYRPMSMLTDGRTYPRHRLVLDRCVWKSQS